MELISLIGTGTPFLVLAILLFQERINTKVSVIQEDIEEIKKGITWHDTCAAKHDEINRRLNHLEIVLNKTD